MLEPPGLLEMQYTQFVYAYMYTYVYRKSVQWIKLMFNSP